MRSNDMTIMTMTKTQQPGTSFGEPAAVGFAEALQLAMEDLGQRHGIYEVMAQVGPVTPHELAGCTGMPEPQLHQWLNVEVVNNRLYYNAPANRYCLWCPWQPGS
ncbi:MAG: hypothetical protein ACE5Q6_14450 [Dehalococcoidia bacterium]